MEKWGQKHNSNFEYGIYLKSETNHPDFNSSNNKVVKRF